MHEGKEVEVNKDKAHLQDSTMLESEPGAQTVGGIIRRKENEAEKEAKREDKKDEDKAREDKDKAHEGTIISLSYGELKKAKERGEDAKTSRSRDGTWAVKNGKSYFGFKLHTKVEARTGLIEDYDVTAASLHDNQVDLSRPGEPMVRDKAYSFVSAKGIAVNMIRASRGNPLMAEDKEANRILSGIRVHVEHPYAVMRRISKFTIMHPTTIPRVKIKAMFMCVSFNLMRAAFLTKPVN
ncbi:MAG: transposase [Nitrososphaerota archaeon]|jgi:IS5 family transposase|nr:transposase [Nitrososphaerota archaeon]MDG6926852.1 transposase [Nitrososphaerota archaeon]MDG6930030.1 transposase [Nitrososphaerota archaeon]MDG6931981.1 transposase [Nitrososphaerota archaeon]MDG6943816.1 transposase [Nitrososphaerota archaeon]